MGCVALLGLGFNLVGCSNEDDLQRSRVTITRMMGAADDDDLSAGVFQSDVADAGEDGVPQTADDVTYEDEILVTVQNDPASPLLGLEPGGPYGSVTLTSYRVEYDMPGEEIDTVSGGLHLVVPTGSSAQAQLVLVTAYAKTQAPLGSLVNDRNELPATATITLTGREQDSDAEVQATAVIEIHFADWADD
jgi:hypothetical protein